MYSVSLWVYEDKLNEVIVSIHFLTKTLNDFEEWHLEQGQEIIIGARKIKVEVVMKCSQNKLLKTLREW